MSVSNFRCIRAITRTITQTTLVTTPSHTGVVRAGRMAGARVKRESGTEPDASIGGGRAVAACAAPL
ncbi:hypothetical protein GCM10022221_37160 [Actinocorallia aurea]